MLWGAHAAELLLDADCLRMIFNTRVSQFDLQIDYQKQGPRKSIGKIREKINVDSLLSFLNLGINCSNSLQNTWPVILKESLSNKKKKKPLAVGSIAEVNFSIYDVFDSSEG